MFSKRVSICAFDAGMMSRGTPLSAVNFHRAALAHRRPMCFCRLDRDHVQTIDMQVSAWSPPLAVSRRAALAACSSCARPRRHVALRQQRMHVSFGFGQSQRRSFAKRRKDIAQDRITPRSEDWAAWYRDVVGSADLVDEAPVRGCKVMKPRGFAVWEAIQRILDPMLKAMGVQNAYFPMLIPLGFFSREAAHVAGFAKECAVVTHYRLRGAACDEPSTIEVDPESKLAEPYVVRPTSETMVWHMYSRWIRSYRDLPMKMNQWVNVMRWEHSTRPFLRTSEFLWQEGHTAHASAAEAEAQARDVLDAYVTLAQDHLALPLVPGRKSENERFAGAVETYTIEVLTQDGKALQAGTSHFLGQNFARAFDVTFETEGQRRDFVWASSWGVSTRLVGAVIMAHSDDDGLVLPPSIAEVQVVIVPVIPRQADRTKVGEAAAALHDQLSKAGVRVHVDSRLGLSPGSKYYEWERKGVPLRLELGPRDLKKDQAMGKKRTGGEKFAIRLGDGAAAEVASALDAVALELHACAASLKERLSFRIRGRAEFEARLRAREPGFLWIPWGGDGEDEAALQEATGVTLRCYPFDQEPVEHGQLCPVTGKPSRSWAVFARAY